MKSSFARWIIFIVSLLIIGFVDQAKSQTYVIRKMPISNTIRVSHKRGTHITLTLSEYAYFVFFVEKIKNRDFSYLTVTDSTIENVVTFPFVDRLDEYYTKVFSFTPIHGTYGYFSVGDSDKVLFSAESLYGAMLNYADRVIQNEK